MKFNRNRTLFRHHRCETRVNRNEHNQLNGDGKSSSRNLYTPSTKTNDTRSKNGRRGAGGKYPSQRPRKSICTCGNRLRKSSRKFKRKKRSIYLDNDHQTIAFQVAGNERFSADKLVWALFGCRWKLCVSK